jgi:hypothetical protein
MREVRQYGRVLMRCLGAAALVAGIAACGEDATGDAANGAAKRGNAPTPTTQEGGTETMAEAPTGDTITATLHPLTDAGVAGKVTLRRVRKQVRVAVRLDDRVPGRLPAHLHIGTCAVQPNLDVLNSLEDVVRGRSDTVLQYTTWADIRTGTFSVHVHAPSFEAIACTDLPGTG